MSKAKQKAQSEASRLNTPNYEVFLTQSSASRFQPRCAQPFIAKFMQPNNWSVYPQELRMSQTKIKKEFKRKEIF